MKPYLDDGDVRLYQGDVREVLRQLSAARKHGRNCVGIELNESYCELAAKRLSQLSLLASGVQQ